MLLNGRNLSKKLNIISKSDDDDRFSLVLDHSKTGSVTRYKFVEFLKGFGPVENCIENVKIVVTAEYFHGFVSATESRLFLDGQPQGTFLIRFSGSRPGAFVLDLVQKGGHIHSVRINSHPQGGFSVMIVGSETTELRLKSLQELVDIYSKKNLLKTPFSSDLSKQPWFFGDISREESEELLKGQPVGTFLVRFSTNQPGCYAVSFVGPEQTILRGLITPCVDGQGYQVASKGGVFANLPAVVKYYIDLGHFVSPLLNYKLKYTGHASDSHSPEAKP